MSQYSEEVEHWMAEGPYQDTKTNQTPNTSDPINSAVRLRGISFVAERETAQIAG